MTHPIKNLTDNAKFAFTGEYLRDSGWSLTASGKGIEIAGVMWPVSQLRVGPETQYGLELYAAKWLLRQRGMEAQAKISHAFNALCEMKAESRRTGS